MRLKKSTKSDCKVDVSFEGKPIVMDSVMHASTLSEEKVDPIRLKSGATNLQRKPVIIFVDS